MNCLRSTVLLVLCVPGLAAAGSVALIPIEANGVEAAGRVVVGGLRAGVEQSPELKESGPVQMSLEEARTSFSCFDESAPCMSEVGAVLRAEHLVWGQLSRDGPDWKLRLVMLDVAKATITRSEQTRVPDSPAAMGHLRSYASAFVRGQALPTFARVSVAIESRPSGIPASVDGRAIGLTPARVELSPGAYTIELSPSGAPPVRRAIQVADQPLQVEMSVETGEAGSAPGLSTGTWLGISSAAVAVVGVGLGTYYGLQSSDNADEAKGLAGDDPRRAALEDEFSQNQVLANIGFGTAIAAGAASLYFLLVHEDGGVAVAPGPSGLTVIGAF